MLRLSDGRTHLYQWDTGQTVTVQAECNEVHFANTKWGKSLPVDVIDGVAKIPDEFLQSGQELYCWMFVRTTEGNYTKMETKFDVKRRPKPADYVTTPTEQASWGNLDARLTTVENKIENVQTESHVWMLENLDWKRAMMNQGTVIVGGNISLISREVHDLDLQISCDTSRVWCTLQCYGESGYLGNVGFTTEPEIFTKSTLPVGTTYILIQMFKAGYSSINDNSEVLQYVTIKAKSGSNEVVKELTNHALTTIDTALLSVVGSGVIE